jgi:acyl dehydratase
VRANQYGRKSRAGLFSSLLEWRLCGAPPQIIQPKQNMPINYDALMASSVVDEALQYSEKDVILYALAVGFGRDPLNTRELPFVYEGAGLHTVPTMAAMLLPGRFIQNCGWDFEKVLHSALRIELYRPLPAAARLLMNRRVASVQDRGPRIGARIEIESEVRLARDDSVLFSLANTLIARGDGGFGGPRVKARLPHRLPDRPPDLTCDLATRADQALVFRLTGDMNPLHADPGIARSAGFHRPILHGRCTTGIACHAIMKTICDYDFTLIRGFDVRFTAPVFPGDILTTEMWQDRNIISFRCIVKNRGVTVISNGCCTLVG